MSNSYNDILLDLKNKQYKPVYFLHGEESFYIDKIVDYIENNILDEGEKAFNQLILYGRDADANAVIDNARQYPMMAPYRVVVLKEAQSMKDISNLTDYITNPSPQCILVVAYKHKKLDKRLSFSKKLQKHAVILESNKLKEYQVAGWINTYVKELGFKMDVQVSQLLAEYLGEDLSKISNAIEKLIIGLLPNDKITMDAVQDKIGISKDYNVFELQKALGSKDVPKASKIINYMVANSAKNPLIMINGLLYSYFTKVMGAVFYKKLSDKELAKKIGLYNAYFIKEYRLAAQKYSFSQLKTIFQYLKEYDAKTKGINSRSFKGGELTKELLYKILLIQ